jgi:hypothetical protein
MYFVVFIHAILEKSHRNCYVFSQKRRDARAQRSAVGVAAQRQAALDDMPQKERAKAGT